MPLFYTRKIFVSKIRRLNWTFTKLVLFNGLLKFIRTYERSKSDTAYKYALYTYITHVDESVRNLLANSFARFGYNKCVSLFSTLLNRRWVFPKLSYRLTAQKLFGAHKENAKKREMMEKERKWKREITEGLNEKYEFEKRTLHRLN